MDQHFELTNQGIADSLAGVESYAFRYYQGQLYANDVIGFNEVNGSEGIVQTVIDKIKQFCAWIVRKFKGLFQSKPIIFTVKTGSVLTIFNKVKYHSALDNYDFHGDSWKEFLGKMREKFDRVKLRLMVAVEQHKNFVKEIQELGKNPEVNFACLENVSETVFPNHVHNYIAEMDTVFSRLEKLDSAKQLSEACPGILYTNLKECFKMSDSMVTFRYYHDLLWKSNKLNEVIDKVIAPISDTKLQNTVAGTLTRLANMNLQFREGDREVVYSIASAIHKEKFWSKPK